MNRAIEVRFQNPCHDIIGRLVSREKNYHLLTYNLVTHETVATSRPDSCVCVRVYTFHTLCPLRLITIVGLYLSLYHSLFLSLQHTHAHTLQIYEYLYILIIILFIHIIRPKTATTTTKTIDQG